MKRMMAALVLGAAATFGGTAVSAQDLLESYVAYIGDNDLYNSKGVRLHEPWQILRQDRANFHRFGIRDDWDDWDRFFDKINNRAAMEQMIMRGWIDPKAARDIVSGGALVKVKIYGYGSVGQKITVDVHR